MKKKIQEIKQKTHAERKTIATWAAGITTGVIVIIWLVLRFTIITPNERNPVFNQKTLDTFIEQTTESFQSLENTFTQQKENFTEVRNEIGEQGELLDDKDLPIDNFEPQNPTEEPINNTQE